MNQPHFQPHAHIVAGIFVGLVCAACSFFDLIGAVLFWSSLAIFFALGVWKGTKLPLAPRTVITVLVLNWSYWTFLQGRTMEPHLSAYTLRMAFVSFGMFGLLPSAILFRVWQPSVGIRVFALSVFAAFGLASLTATVEEKVFVRRHQAAGIGPTPRWTVPHHWLEYNKATQTLYGSD
jgi:hypothetical protein